ncbi:Retrovirus-related Pol polyprotein from transposon RE2 [Sesamum angolense]|uniref:Retrovirus-related Pol polyprotein from transposon RE2 n=1 Tax=Sesamum angolense TaxID=2727404 RepID=A0AAE1W376_9LAMI|nr:Retrovirus-related Pol polyprotein from transposon RE2 [Sesamum angolense]
MAHVNLNERVHTVTLSCEEYEQLLHRPAAPSATPSSPGTFIASHGESWMIDSGATSHLTGNRSSFLTFSTSPKFPPVRIADGSYSPISGSGTVRPTDYLTLTNVLFAPKFPVNLLSVNHLTKTHNCSVTFYPSYCVIQDLQTRRTIGTGHERGGLYFLDTTPLSMLAPSLPRFPLFSGILVLDRSQVPTIITSFYNEIYTQFSVNIRILRTDNALEFVQKSVSDFCNSKGILHQTSCLYTSQQNGVAKRKHRHLLDVARTIMTHMHVPKSYWGDAVLTACYLINHMPSTVLHGDTPYSCLFPDKPLFGIAPRVFGCYFLRIHFFLLATVSCRHSSTLSSLACPHNVCSPAYRATYPPITGVSLSSVSIPNTYCEALRHPAWKMAMDDEMSALVSRGTWELVEVPPNADIVACRWVFTLKFRADGTLERYKARLVAKGFTRTYGVDYFETFSPVARLNSIRVLFSLAVNFSWPMYQMDIKNAFLYGDLNETVYMEQPPGYVAQGEKQRMVCKLKKAIYGLKQSPRAWFDKFSRIIGEFGFSRCQADHSVFVQTTTSGMVVLAVYVDDILITGSDLVGIEEAKTYLQKHFVTKDLGRPRYFLGIEIAHSKHGISLSQRKYACDLLHEAGLLGTKPVDTPMDSNPDFSNDDGNYLEDKTKYRRLVGKLIYLTVTRPDISFAVGLVSQFMNKPRLVHWEAALRILKYIKASPGKGLLFKRHGHVKIEAYSDADYAGAKDDRKSTSGYCTYVGGNLVTWRSKKQTTVARSSAEAEYRAMAHTTSEILWLKNLLKELGFMYDDPVPMHCDNQAAIHIASNPIFHERTKHIEVDCHFVREAVMSQEICTPFTPSSEQRADIFTKALGGKPFDVLCNKLGMIDIFAPA